MNIFTILKTINHYNIKTINEHIYNFKSLFDCLWEKKNGTNLSLNYPTDLHIGVNFGVGNHMTNMVMNLHSE